MSQPRLSFRRSKRWLLSLLAVGLLIGGVHSDESPESKRGAPLEERIARLLPTDAENRWRRIAWHSDLLTARREANRTGKPIFMWIMNGSPLGCT